MFKKIVVGLLLVSSITFSDKIKVFRGTNLAWLETEINSYAKHKVIRSVSITFSEKYNSYIIVVSTVDEIEA